MQVHTRRIRSLRLVESRELPEPLNYDWTHPVWPTGCTPASGPLWTNTYAPCHLDRTLNSDFSASGHCIDPEFGHLVNSAAPGQNTGRVRYGYRTRPVTSERYRTRLVLTSDASSHPMISAFNSFSSPTSSPLQICQHHQVYTTMCMCVSFSQTF